jgi:hypothetical protein
MTGAGVVTGTSQGIAAAVAEHMRMDCERHLGAPPNEDVRGWPWSRSSRLWRTSYTAALAAIVNHYGVSFRQLAR